MLSKWIETRWTDFMKSSKCITSTVTQASRRCTQSSQFGTFVAKNKEGTNSENASLGAGLKFTDI